jgi:hypothetical protein
MEGKGNIQLRATVGKNYKQQKYNTPWSSSLHILLNVHHTKTVWPVWSPPKLYYFIKSFLHCIITPMGQSMWEPCDHEKCFQKPPTGKHMAVWDLESVKHSGIQFPWKWNLLGKQATACLGSLWLCGTKPPNICWFTVGHYCHYHQQSTDKWFHVLKWHSILSHFHYVHNFIQSSETHIYYINLTSEHCIFCALCSLSHPPSWVLGKGQTTPHH